MGNVIVAKQDFYNITWEKYNDIAVKLGEEIKSYCLKNGYEIDCIIWEQGKMKNIDKIIPGEYTG